MSKELLVSVIQEDILEGDNTPRWELGSRLDKIAHMRKENTWHSGHSGSVTQLSGSHQRFSSL